MGRPRDERYAETRVSELAALPLRVLLLQRCWSHSRWKAAPELCATNARDSSTTCWYEFNISWTCAAPCPTRMSQRDTDIRPLGIRVGGWLTLHHHSASRIAVSGATSGNAGIQAAARGARTPRAVLLRSGSTTCTPACKNGYPLGEKATESTRRGSWSLAPRSARTSNQVVVGCTRTVRPTAKAPP